VARIRTTKKLAQGIDLNYFKRPTPYKRARILLVALLPLLALVWIAWWGLRRDSRVYSSGRMSGAHAVLEKQCAACHVRQASEFSARAADGACLACHDGPIHHENQVKAAVPECVMCHVEHRGQINIRAASNQSCAECHGDLRATTGKTHYAIHIRSIEDGHPEFAALRNGAKDPGTIRLNHAIHMKPIRRGPNGPIVQLECSDCHRPAAVKTEWQYAEARYVNATVTYKEEDESLPVKSDTLGALRGTSGREYMAPVKFATACAQCHLLTFDKRFEDGVPHDKPEVVRSFLVKRYGEYIAAHPAELHEMQEPSRMLTGRFLPAGAQFLTASQWITEHTAVAEELLWKKTCAQCHDVSGAKLQDTALGRWDAASGQGGHGAAGGSPTAGVLVTGLPVIAEAKTTTQWLPHAKFDHDAHRGFSCVGCHAKALTSKEASDVLVPGIENCKTCHAPGRSEERR
jgi:hypothetical protein